MSLFSGLRAFVVQRVSALVLLACLGGLALRLAFGPRPTYAGWQAWVAQPFGAAALLTLATALVLHAWVGVRDVVLDYVHPPVFRLTFLAILAVGLVALASWTLFIVLTHAVSHL